MTAILQSGWATMLIGTLLYLGVTVMLLDPKHLLPPGAAPAAKGDDLPPLTLRMPWDNYNPELDRLMTELLREKEELAVKEKQLAELEARLQAERAELAGVTQLVQRLQADFDQRVLRIKTEEEANLRKLAKIFASMSTDNAVTLFRHFDDRQVVKILSFFKDTEIAAILETMAAQGELESKRAATLSEMLKVTVKPDPADSAAATPTEQTTKP